MDRAIGKFVGTLQHEVFDGGVLSGAKELQTGLEFVGAEISEEAEPSEVDTEDGELSRAELATTPKNTPVAAEDHDHVSMEIGGDRL
ncbi:MAG: hypothetical protein RL215_928 [Planctomycetota bacterium]